MVKIGIIGYGYWGPNIARNVYSTDGIELVAICDKSEERRNIAAKQYAGVKIYSDPKKLILSEEINTVAVVTPVYTHYELGKQVLESGKNLFIEKPFVSNVAQGDELINIALKRDLMIMVDHTFLFTGAVRKMREIIEAGELGDLFFFDSVRVNLGLFQHDINVIWDLAPHDISIMDYVTGKNPTAVSAIGARHFQTKFEDIAYLTVHFPDDFLAHFHCNWLTPVKIRKTLISGSKRMLVWDDLLADEKVKVYDKGVEIKSVDGIYNLLISYRSGDMYAPKTDNREALGLEMEYFVQCVEDKKQPFNNGELGLRVVKVLEAADKSLKSGGKKIQL